MLQSNLGKFIVKRLLIFFVILSILDLIFLNQRWMVLAGLTLGGVFSLFRFNSLASFFMGVRTGVMPKAGQTNGAGQILFKYFFNQVITLALLAASLKYDLWLFTGMTAGVLLVPFVVLVNGISEGLGISHNNFEWRRSKE